MKVESLRFGPLEVPDGKLITMARPILGFEHLQTFCLVDVEELRPLLWFQSTEDPAVAFLVGNPLLFYPDYRIEINPQEIAELNVDRVEAVETWVIITIPDDPKSTSVNLQGPILVNTETNLAKQLVLVNSSYRVRHYILERDEELLDTDEDAFSKVSESVTEERIEELVEL